MSKVLKLTKTENVKVITKGLMRLGYDRTFTASVEVNENGLPDFTTDENFQYPRETKYFGKSKRVQFFYRGVPFQEGESEDSLLPDVEMTFYYRNGDRRKFHVPKIDFVCSFEKDFDSEARPLLYDIKLLNTVVSQKAPNKKELCKRLHWIEVKEHHPDFKYRDYEVEILPITNKEANKRLEFDNDILGFTKNDEMKTANLDVFVVEGVVYKVWWLPVNFFS
jgi:hypothetical protein